MDGSNKEASVVRAKFKVTRCLWLMGNGSATIELAPVGGAVGGESDENKAFFAATPGGLISLSVVNAAAAAQFVEGAEYYIDFTRADA